MTTTAHKQLALALNGRSAQRSIYDCHSSEQGTRRAQLEAYPMHTHKIGDAVNERLH